MHERILQRIREKIRLRLYVMTVHADEEQDDDTLTIFDVENALLTGAIIERQRDRTTREAKYLIRGLALDGARSLVTVVKIGPTGKVIILTVYAE